MRAGRSVSALRMPCFRRLKVWEEPRSSPASPRLDGWRRRRPLPCWRSLRPLPTGAGWSGAGNRGQRAGRRQLEKLWGGKRRRQRTEEVRPQIIRTRGTFYFRRSWRSHISSLWSRCIQSNHYSEVCPDSRATACSVTPERGGTSLFPPVLSVVCSLTAHQGSMGSITGLSRLTTRHVFVDIRGETWPDQSQERLVQQKTGFVCLKFLH